MARHCIGCHCPRKPDNEGDGTHVKVVYDRTRREAVYYCRHSNGIYTPAAQAPMKSGHVAFTCQINKAKMHYSQTSEGDLWQVSFQDSPRYSDSINTIVTRRSIESRHLLRIYTEQLVRLQVGEKITFKDAAAFGDLDLSQIKDTFTMIVNDEVRYFSVISSSVELDSLSSMKAEATVVRLAPNSWEATQFRLLANSERKETF